MPEPQSYSPTTTTLSSNMKTTNTRSGARFSRSAFPTTPLAALQEKFLNAILPQALSRLLPSAKRSLLSSQDVLKPLSDSLDLRMFEERQAFLLEWSSTCALMMKSWEGWLGRMERSVVAAIRESSDVNTQTHKAWQRVTIVAVVVILILGLAGTATYCYHLHQDSRLVLLQRMLEAREAELRQTKTDLARYQELSERRASRARSDAPTTETIPQMFPPH